MSRSPAVLVLTFAVAAMMALVSLPSLSAPEPGPVARSEEPPGGFTRYFIEVKLDPELHTLSGRELVDYYNDGDAPLSALYFLLLPNFAREKNPYLDSSYIDQEYWWGFDPAWMKVYAVRDAAGEPLPWELLASPPELQTYSLEETLLRVELPEPLPPGEVFTAQIEFATKFPHTVGGDQGYHRDIYVWRFGWHPIALPAGELAPDKEGYQRFILPAAWYEALITLPEGWVLATGADEQELISVEKGEEEKEEKEDLIGAPEGANANGRWWLTPGKLGEQLSERLDTLPRRGRTWQTVRLRSVTPVRSLPLVAGPGELLGHYRLEGQEYSIEVYYLPGDEDGARLLATYALEILTYYSERYGPYPRRKLTLVESVAPGLWGMAADGFVLLGRSAVGERDLGVRGLTNRLVEWLLAHELAHQWFGIGVGADFNAENWLSEAFAQYLSISYFEEKYGPFGPNVFVFEREGLLEKLITRELGFYNLRQHSVELPYLVVRKDHFDEAIIKPQKEVEYANWSFVRIYDKGYLVLRALAGLIGEDKMGELLRRAYERFNHRIATVEELEALAEEVAGQDLDEFFQEWLFAADWVDYGIEGVKSKKGPDGTYLNEVRLSRQGGASLPVKVVATTKDGEELEWRWDAREPEATWTFKTESPLKEVAVDPEELTPDVNRLNNHHPLKLRVITTGKRDLPLDAYLLRLDPATQTVEGGTLWHRWLLGQGLAALAVYLGRDSLLLGYLDLRWLELYHTLAGELRVELTRYSHPQVGLAGRFWEPTDQFTLSFGRRLDPKSGESANFLGASWRRSELLTRRYTAELELLGYPGEFWRVSLAIARPFRLLPHVYLAWEASLGLGEGLPEVFKFTLDELHSFWERTEEGGERKLLYPGEVKLFSRLALSFPAKREMDYDLLGLALIEETRERLYLALGETWEGLGEVQMSLDELKAEVGMEGLISGRTLGGLFPFTATVGFAYPLLGIEPEDRQGRIYISLELPLF